MTTLLIRSATLPDGTRTDLGLRDGVFAYKDAWKKKLMGAKKLEAVMTIRNGKLAYDVEGRAFPEWTTAGEYEVIR